MGGWVGVLLGLDSGVLFVYVCVFVGGWVAWDDHIIPRRRQCGQ
jgi:hypothetical protein